MLGADFAKNNGPFLSSRIDNVDKEIIEINAKFGTSNTFSSDSGYELRIQDIEAELSSLRDLLSANGIDDENYQYADSRTAEGNKAGNASSSYNDYDEYNGIYNNKSNRSGNNSADRHTEYTDYEEYYNPLRSNGKGKSNNNNDKNSSGSNINIRRFSSSAAGDFVGSFANDSESSVNKPYVGARTAANPSAGGINIAKKSSDKAAMNSVKYGGQTSHFGASNDTSDVRGGSTRAGTTASNPLSPGVVSTLVSASASASANASRRSSASAGTPTRDSLTPRSQSINNLIAKFSSGTSPPRSTGNSFIGELINNVHSDIYPYPSPMREDGHMSSEEDNSHPHTTCNLNRSGLGSLRGREAGSNSTDIRGFESFHVDGEVEDSEDDVTNKRRGSDNYIGKKTPAPVPVSAVTMSSAREVKDDPEVDFDYSHIHDKDPFDSIPNARRVSVGSRTSTSGKYSDERDFPADKTARDEEEAFRNKIFDENEGDFDSAFTETNPMKRKTVKNTAVARVFTNPTKKIVLKSSIMSVVANTKKTIPNFLTEKTDSADSIPDISESDEIRFSPFTVIDERDSPGEKSLNSVYMAADGNSPVSDFEKMSEHNDRFLTLSRCDSIPLPKPTMYSMMDAFSPNMPQVKEHLRSSTDDVDSSTKKSQDGRVQEDDSFDFANVYSDSPSIIHEGSGSGSGSGKYAAFMSNPIRSADSDAGNISIIKPIRINDSDIKKALSSSTMSSDSNAKYTAFVTAPSKGQSKSQSQSASSDAKPMKSPANALKPLDVELGREDGKEEGKAGKEGKKEDQVEDFDVSKSSSDSPSKCLPQGASKYSTFLKTSSPKAEDDRTQPTAPATAPATAPVTASPILSVSVPSPVQAPIPTPVNSSISVATAAVAVAAAGSNRSPGALIDSNSSSKQTSPVSVSTTTSEANAKYAAFVNSSIKKTDSNIKITETINEVTVVKQTSIIVTSNNMDITPKVELTKKDNVMPTSVRPVASKENSMSTLDSMNGDEDNDKPALHVVVQPRSVEKMKSLSKPLDSPTDPRPLGGRFDLRKSFPYPDESIAFLGDQGSARPRSLRHISEIAPSVSQSDGGNKINWADLKQNLRRTDSGRNQGLAAGTSTPPVLSFAMTDFNSSDDSDSGDDEDGGQSPSLAMLRSGGTNTSDSSIIPRNHREISSGASSHSTSYSNLYSTEQPRPTSVGYSKSYSTSEDVERKHQDLLAAEKIPPYPGMFLSKSRNNSESRLSICSDRSDGHGVNQGQKGGIATTAAPVPAAVATSATVSADYIENDTQPRTGSVRLLTEKIFSESNVKSVMGVNPIEKKTDSSHVAGEGQRKGSASSVGLSKVTAIDLTNAKNYLEGDSNMNVNMNMKEDENGSEASSSSVGQGKGGSMDSIPARGLKSNSELTPRGLPSTVTALSKSTANGIATTGIAHSQEVSSPVRNDIVQSSPDMKKSVDKSAKEVVEVTEIEIKKADVTVTPAKKKEDDVKPLKSTGSSPSMLRPLPPKNGRTKSSENPMATPPLSTSPTPNDIKTGSASLMTYFTASDRASPSTVLQSNRPKTPTLSQEQPLIGKKEKESSTRSRSLGGQTGPTSTSTPGHYYEPPNAKLPADKTMEKSIALMISKAAENENHSEHEYEALSPKSTTSTSSSVKNTTDSNINLKKDKLVVTQSAGDVVVGPKDIIPPLIFLSPDNVMAPLSTRYNIQ